LLNGSGPEQGRPAHGRTDGGDRGRLREPRGGLGDRRHLHDRRGPGPGRGRGEDAQQRDLAALDPGSAQIRRDLRHQPGDAGRRQLTRDDKEECMDDATAEELTSRQRVVWGAGDWPGFAPRIQEVADQTVEAIGVAQGDVYLDVATGSGNAAEAAARRGARVNGLDLVPDLIDAARARFESAGLEGEFVVGDAERLPYEDDSFNKVTSIFGVMFAPRQEAAAAELVRVARPGAVIGVAAWTPTGSVGQMFKTIAQHMPPPPEEFVPAVMWGDEDHVRGLFAGSDVQLEGEKRMAQVEIDAPQQVRG